MRGFEDFGISPEIERISAECEAMLTDRFREIDMVAEFWTGRALSAFKRARISEVHLGGTTGYGYGDSGREAIDRIYADMFGCESALVRHFMLSGTHALTVALFGLLRPGNTLFAVTGRPYDTLTGVIGIDGSGSGMGSLAEFGVGYCELPLKDGEIDFEGLEKFVRSDGRADIFYIQRSRGYDRRPSITVDRIERAVSVIRAAGRNAVVMVDNCYGEFVEYREPTMAGADLAVGSLIKNPGGGVALSGGYIVGRRELVEKCAYRLTSPGLGGEVGASIGENRNILRGIFMAPHTVGEAMKTAAFASALFERLGFTVSPRWSDEWTDIVLQIDLMSEKGLISFCEGIQQGSPVDSHVTPYPWEMPGYADKVIMAAGAFVGGSSLELSADGPLRHPYTAYVQGGIVYHAGKIGIMRAAERLFEERLLGGVAGLME